MENIEVQALILKKESPSKTDRGEFNMVRIYIDNGPINYARCNVDRTLYDYLDERAEVGLIIDYRFFQDKCTGIKIKGIA